MNDKTLKALRKIESLEQRISELQREVEALKESLGDDNEIKKLREKEAEED